MDQIVEKIIDLGVGTVSSIIGGTIFAIIGISVSTKSKRKSKLEISGSKVKGDVVQGDKTKSRLGFDRHSYDKRTSDISVIDTEVGGDIVQGDKES